MQTDISNLRTVKTKGSLLDTQDVAFLVGRNWQAINKLRSAGCFIEPSARCGNAFLYAKSKVLAWARKSGHVVNPDAPQMRAA